MSSAARARFRSLLEDESVRAGLELTQHQCDLLEIHFALLDKWNRTVRLIGTTAPDEVVRRHTLESIALIPFIPPGASTLLDVGSGNGFPAIPIKCIREDLDVTMLEPAGRKRAFLQQVIADLHLPAISVRPSRIDKPSDLSSEAGGAGLGCITMRAVAAIPTLMKGAPAALMPGGRLLLLTGEAGRSEVRRMLQSPLRIVAEQRLPHMQASFIVAVERADS